MKVRPFDIEVAISGYDWGKFVKTTPTLKSTMSTGTRIKHYDPATCKNCGAQLSWYARTNRYCDACKRAFNDGRDMAESSIADFLGCSKDTAQVMLNRWMIGPLVYAKHDHPQHVLGYSDAINDVAAAFNTTPEHVRHMIKRRKR